MVESGDNRGGQSVGSLAQHPPVLDDCVADVVQERYERAGRVLSLDRQKTLLNGLALGLSPTECRILKLLASRPGETLTRQQILDGIHNQLYAITERAVDTQIVGLRRKLGEWSNHIETVRGSGYRFRP